jgi:hypothetical protein
VLREEGLASDPTKGNPEKEKITRMEMGCLYRRGSQDKTTDRYVFRRHAFLLLFSLPYNNQHSKQDTNKDSIANGVGNWS